MVEVADKTLLLASHFVVRLAGAVLAHVDRPAASCWMHCRRTLGG